MKIFYSWQSDSPAHLNRYFVRDALRDALKALKSDPEIVDAIRSSNDLHLDHDTKGVKGAVPIAQVILEKIDMSSVVVCDVTLVAKGTDGKPHINSNVAIELGYALGKHGYGCVLNVMNTADGRPEALPFDLRDRSHPVQYNATAELTKEELKAVRNRLTADFVEILRQYLKSAQAENAVGSPPSANFEPAKPTFVPSAFWQRQEPLCTRVTKQFVCSEELLVSLRILPKSAQERLTRSECKERVSDLGPFGRTDGHYNDVNSWGGISFGVNFGTRDICSATQLFESREIWCFDDGFFEQIQTHEGLERVLFVPARLSDELPRNIQKVVQSAKSLIIGPMDLQLTASSLKGCHLRVGDSYFYEDKPFFDDSVTSTIVDPVSVTPRQMTRMFINALYNAAGQTPNLAALNLTD